MTTPIAADLRAWASGNWPVEAATELLIRAFRGRFAQPGHPWIRDDDRGLWIDFDAITDETTAVYSGGERRVLALVASLGGHCEVNLAETVSGLDRSVLLLVLAAIAHAAGSHRHADVRVDPVTGDADLVELGSLFPWPGCSSEGRRTTVPGPDRPTRPAAAGGGAMLTDRRSRVRAHPPASAFDLAAAVGTVRRLSDTITPACRGALLYDLVRAVRDSAKHTAVTTAGERHALADVVDAVTHYWSAAWDRQCRHQR